MKKILVVFLLFFFLEAGAMESCCEIIPKKTFSGVVFSISGVNFLVRNFAQSQISKVIKKETNSKVKTKIKTFFGINPFSGVFESISFESKNFCYEDFYITKLDAKTTNSINKVKYQNDELFLCDGFGLNFSAIVEQNELNKFVLSENYKKHIAKINNNLIKIKDSNIEIIDNKLRFINKISVLGLKTIKVTFSAKLEIKDGKIILCTIDMNNKNTIPEILLPAIEKMCSLSYDFDMNSSQKINIDILNINIENSKIKINGIIKVK